MKKEKVLIVGAGVAGRELYYELKKHFSHRFSVVGFLDDNPRKWEKKIEEVEILGGIDKLSGLVRKFKISEVFIAVPSAKGSLIRKVIKSCEKEKVVFKIVPRLLEIVEGKVKFSKVREIEAEDLLGRALVKSEQDVFKKEFGGKTILVTGAAGSIGSEIVRQLLQFNPKKLIGLDFWESGLYELGLEFSGSQKESLLKCTIANIQDFPRIREIMDLYKPEIIFHAAAYKHVPLMQDFPIEAVKNNIFGTENVAKAAVASKVSKFVNISTDKAVEPTSVMGATKLIAEYLVKEFNKKGKTRFCSVRFGNVLGSQGSVVPTFKKQILKGGPVTVTTKNMTRYFMSIPEAVQLVLTASLLTDKGGETFMLDMGEPVNIDELARMMIKLAGFVPDTDIKINYTGPRPGEKFEEKLMGETESFRETAKERIFLVDGSRTEVMVSALVAETRDSMEKGEKSKVLAILKKIAPNIK